MSDPFQEQDLSGLRKDYTQESLTEAAAGDDPMALFDRWFRLAEQHNAGAWYEPNVVSLATVAPGSVPSVRIVLLKAYDRDGLTFFTSYTGRKAREMETNPNVAMLMHWAPLERQVRIVGLAEKVDAETSAAYFATRPRGSQLGAVASAQSEIVTRQQLQQAFADAEARYEGRDIPCPSNWGGYRVRPVEMEFWQGQPNRMHDRIQFIRDVGDTWQRQRLAP